MIALNDGAAPIAEVSKPRRASKRSGDQATRSAPARVAKSKDAAKVKVSLYLDTQTAEKLAVASILRRIDQSDTANEILSRSLSSIAYYDRAATRPTGEVVLAGEIGPEPAA